MRHSCFVWAAAVVLAGLACGVASAASAQTERVVASARALNFVIEVDDAIERANGHYDPEHPRLHFHIAQEWGGMARLSEVFLRFFGGVTPNATGVERPSGDEHMIDEFEVDLGNRFSYVLMGAANDHVLTSLHFYQQFDGLQTIRYDLLRPEGGWPFRVALGIAPVYGSLTVITRHNGVYDDESLPTSVVVGGAGGLDVWYPLQLVQFHARVWALPGVDVINGGPPGVALVESVQLKWRLTETFRWDPAWPADFGLILTHSDRGDARNAVYDWRGDFRDPRELREVWQVMGILELRVN